MSKALAKKIDDLEGLIQSSVGCAEPVVYGLFNAEIGHVRSIKEIDGEWVDTLEPYIATLPEKLEPLLTRPKRFNVIIGGRGSSKSNSIATIEAERIKTYGIKVGCFREFQNSIEDSVFSLIQNQVNRMAFDGFTYPNSSVKSSNGGGAKFRGLARNPDSMKSMDGFKDFWVEEAQATSANSLKLLTPTMRAKGGRIIFSANPASSEDAFSKRFIAPFKNELDRDGIYEDDLHLVIMINWRDNYWFPEGLKSEREWDFRNLPRAMYDHIWEGEFNDSVENAIIPSEWFDACIDAHEKLGFKPMGAKVLFHDPSDTGPDAKGLAYRHGSVFLDVQEKTDGDSNAGMDWALDYAISNSVDHFGWDCDGLGAALKRQVNEGLKGKPIEAIMFKGSERPFKPDSIYDCENNVTVRQNKKNKEIFRNKRSQCYARLQDRVYATFRAVTRGDYVNPDEMISFSSSIKNIGKLRSEICRLPLKENGNGFYQIMTKKEMATHKPPIPSPNMADSVMMCLADLAQKEKEIDISSISIPKKSYW